MWYLSFSFKPLLLQAVVGILAFLQKKTEVSLAQVRRQANASGGGSLAARQNTMTQGVLLVPRAHPRQGGLSPPSPSPGRSLVSSSCPREAGWEPSPSALTAAHALTVLAPGHHRAILDQGLAATVA